VIPPSTVSNKTPSLAKPLKHFLLETLLTPSLFSGAWTLARAQQTEIDILDDDDVSVISNSTTDDEDEAKREVRFSLV